MLNVPCSFIFSITLRVIQSSGQAELEPLVGQQVIESTHSVYPLLPGLNVLDGSI